MSLFNDWTKYKGIRFSNNGDYLDTFKINKKESKTDFDNRTYNFIKEGSFFKIDKLFYKVKYYFYDIDNPNPKKLDSQNQPILNSQVYNGILKNDLIKKITNWGEKNILLELLTPRNLIILGVLIAIIWFFSSGGQISDLSKP